MNSDIARRLVDLNRAFYQSFAAPFSETRAQAQPGVRRLLERIPSASSVADLGCGNGVAARWLAGHGHAGPYRGFDLSEPLLAIARSAAYPFPSEFQPVDFLEEGWDRRLPAASFSFLLAFALLHHLPGEAGRLAFLGSCRRLLSPGGELFLSNWQFLRSEKLRARIVPWAEAGLSGDEVDPGDYLLDWRREGRGLRYVHLMEGNERRILAEKTGFRERECFESDGQGGRLAEYAVWGIDPDESASTGPA